MTLLAHTAWDGPRLELGGSCMGQTLPRHGHVASSRGEQLQVVVWAT